MSGLISVIVPVYNARKHIRKCLESIVKQTYENIEIILIDDGSTDGSNIILDQYASKDKRIRVIHKENAGSFEARKSGISAISTNSSYFCFCDSDDILPKDAIKLMHIAIVKDDADICVGNSKRLVVGMKCHSKYQPPVFNDIYKVYEHGIFIKELYCSWFGISNLPVTLWGKLFKTSIYRDVILSVPKLVEFFGDDLIVTINCFPIAKKVTVINKNVYFYRFGGGTSKYQAAMMNDWISLYNYKKKFALEYVMPQNIEYLMNVELCNMVFSYFEMLYTSKIFEDDEVVKAIKKVCEFDEVKKAAKSIMAMKGGNDKAKMICECNTKQIISILKNQYKKKIMKRAIKRFLSFIG